MIKIFKINSKSKIFSLSIFFWLPILKDYKTINISKKNCEFEKPFKSKYLFEQVDQRNDSCSSDLCHLTAQVMDNVGQYSVQNDVTR